MRKPIRFLPRRGFSLVEVLVAAALLVIIGVLLAQLTSAMSRAIKVSNQAVDAAAQARITFDRIGMDLGSAVIREDTDFQASASSTNFMTFVSTIPSADPKTPIAGFLNRQISLISYRLGPNDSGFSRAGKAIGWNTNYTGFMGIKTNGLPVRFGDPDFPNAANNSILDIVDDDYDALSPAVIHAVFGFQLYPDGQPVRLADATTVTAQGQIVYSPPMRGTSGEAATYVDPSRISSIVVGLVVVDPDKLKILNSSDRTALAQLFTTPATGQLPVAHWMAATDNLDANKLGTAPLPVRQSVRLFQRFFPVNPFQPY